MPLTISDEIPDLADETAGHAFGGLWTARKLRMLRQYLEVFPVALSRQSMRLIYVDTFAGTGKCTIVSGRNGQATIEGSAAIALKVKRPFDHYYFIEKRRKHVDALTQLRDACGMPERVTVMQGDAAARLASVLENESPWKKTRGVLFLDPYGLQCSWDMVREIASTRALDVFFLVNIGGLSRNAARGSSKLTQAKRAALTRFLGTDAWEHAWYRPPDTLDLFDDPQEPVRVGGVKAILQFVGMKMREAFAHVEEPVMLRNRAGSDLYALYFAVSNPSPAAIALAAKVHNDIMVKLN